MQVCLSCSLSSGFDFVGGLVLGQSLPDENRWMFTEIDVGETETHTYSDMHLCKHAHTHVFTHW